MPKSYQILPPERGEKLLPWSGVDERLQNAHNYWVATTRPNGRPHVMPVWGIWLNQTFYFSTDRQSRKARNLVANPSVAVHLESGDDVVILEGVASEVTGRSLFASIDEAYFAKYRIRVTSIPGDVTIFAIQPRMAFAWRERDFNSCATRWIFSDAAGKNSSTQRKNNSRKRVAKRPR